MKFNEQNISPFSFLVTGGAGFIGSNIVRYLLENNAGKVRVLDDLSTGFKKNMDPFLSNKNFEFIEGSICDKETCSEACKNIDFVLHQAALGSVPRSVSDPISTHNVNVSGFLNMLVSARDQSVKRFIYASSSSVYGDSLILPKKENLIGNPLSPYGVSKLSNELYAHVFSLNYKMAVIGLRYFNIFGPGQNPQGAYAAAIPLFMNALLSDKAPVIYGDGNQSRDFTFVENAVQANLCAVFAPEAALGKVYNVAVGNSISLNELLKILNELLGKDIKPIFKERRIGEVQDSLADIQLASSLLGYIPQTNLKECLEKTVNAFRKAHY